MLVIPMSKRFLKRSFEKTKYRFTDKPEPVVDGDFGIYVHVPFCRTKCNFCPFYKELYDFKKCSKYVDAVISEIESSPIHGKASWIYFGGGTPNMLTVHQLDQIKNAIQKKVKVENIGIELLPDVLNTEYIRELRLAKFTKVSIGVESLKKDVLGSTGRMAPGKEGIANLVKEVKYRGLWINLDFMIGLPGQTKSSFMEDMKDAAEMDPSQITIYPFMTLGKIKTESPIPDKEQYQIIEEAGIILEKAGYKRSGIWTFSKGNDIYDSSRDELIEDYFGFGPAAFSTYGQWKVVNPELDIYLKDHNAGKSRGFVAPKTEESDNWRKFARKLYDMDFSDTSEFVKEQKKVLGLLKKSGFIAKDGQLTDKGIIYAHDITKTVVENLPYPLQNPDRVENYDEYLAAKGIDKGIGLLD